MEKWEKALNKFLERYQDKDYYEGAIACGSYVSKNNNEFSDIDVHLVLKRGNEWRERGNLEVDGFLIEYFANPVNKYECYFQEEFSDFDCCTLAMFANGIVVSDKNGEVKKLKEKASELLKGDVRDLSEFELLTEKYHCWDSYDELCVAFKENRSAFYLIYFELYKRLVGLCTKIKNMRTMSFTKLDKLLMDKIFRDNYGISKFYDEYETEIIKKCIEIEEKEVMLNKITVLYNYVMKIAGGFDINKFVLRSEVK